MPRMGFRILLSAALLLALGSPVLKADDPKSQPAVSAKEALNRLKEGNERFVAGKPIVRDLAKRRDETAEGQAPFAIVLSCADSRVSPELVFDQGIGDLFVLRVAGNVTDPVVLGSIEYAVDHLHPSLIVVLGHEKCGAVAAAVAGGHLEGNLGVLIEKVHLDAKQPTEKDAAVAAGVRANALFQATEMTKHSTPLKDFAEAGRIQIVTGVYILDSGKVDWLAAQKAEPNKEVKPDSSKQPNGPAAIDVAAPFVLPEVCYAAPQRRGLLAWRGRRW